MRNQVALGRASGPAAQGQGRWAAPRALRPLCGSLASAGSRGAADTAPLARASPSSSATRTAARILRREVTAESPRRPRLEAVRPRRRPSDRHTPGEDRQL